VAGVVVAIAALTVAWILVIRGRAGDQLPPVVPSPSTTATSAVLVIWHVAELDPTGTKLTVFLESSKGCHPQATVRYSDSIEVAVSVEAQAMRECSGFAGMPLTVSLQVPLTTQEVFDGSPDHTARLICRRASLPRPPAEWTETPAPTTWDKNQGWALNYNLANSGSSIQFVAQFPAPSSNGESVSVRGQQGTLYPFGDTYRFVWRPPTDSHDYQLVLMPAEGASMAKQEFLNLLNTFTWPR
jgi:hypothetical protein